MHPDATGLLVLARSPPPRIDPTAIRNASVIHPVLDDFGTPCEVVRKQCYSCIKINRRGRLSSETTTPWTGFESPITIPFLKRTRIKVSLGETGSRISASAFTWITSPIFSLGKRTAAGIARTVSSVASIWTPAGHGKGTPGGCEQAVRRGLEKRRIRFRLSNIRCALRLLLHEEVPAFADHESPSLRANCPIRPSHGMSGPGSGPGLYLPPQVPLLPRNCSQPELPALAPTHRF